MISFYFISLICLFTQWSSASFIIFETKSEVNFNEVKRSLHLNNQYQYYTIKNVDIPGIWYNYESIVNYIYLNGYIDKNHHNNTERCQLVYSISNSNSYGVDENNSTEPSSSNNSTMTIPNLNTSDKNGMNMVNLSYLTKKQDTFYPKNSSSYTFKFQISNHAKNNSTKDDNDDNDNDDEDDKKTSQKINKDDHHSNSTKNNSTSDDKPVKEEDAFTVAIDHSIKPSNENPSIKKMVKINSPILFINYNDIQQVGCSLYDIITANHWNNIIRVNTNTTLDIIMENEQEKENSNDEELSSNKIFNNPMTPSLLAFIVDEMELDIIKKESNTNKIGIKYVKQSLASTIPITFISGKEYTNLMDSLESKELWIQVTPDVIYYFLNLISKEEEERLKELDNNKWYLATSKVNMNSISNSDISTTSKFKSINTIDFDSSSSNKSKTTTIVKNTESNNNDDVTSTSTSTSMNNQKKNTSSEPLKNKKSDSYFRNLYKINNNDNSDNKKIEKDSLIYSPSIKVPLSPLTKMEKLPYPIETYQTPSNKSNINQKPMPSLPDITVKKNDKLLPSSQPTDLDAYIIDILNNHTSIPDDFAISPMTNTPYSTCTTISTSSPSTFPSTTTTTYSNNNEYHFPSVFDQPPIDFTSRYRSLVTSIKPRNTYRDIYCKKLQENHKKNSTNHHLSPRQYNDSFKNDQETILLKKSSSTLSITTDSLPTETTNTSSKTIIQPNSTISHNSDTSTSNETITQLKHTSTSSNTTDTNTSTSSQSTSIKTNSLTKSSKRIPLQINTDIKSIPSESKPMSPTVEPEKKLKKLYKMKNKLLKGITTTLTTVSPFDKDKENHDPINTKQIENHNPSKTNTLNYANFPISIEISHKNPHQSDNGSSEPVVNNIYSSKVNDSILSLENDVNDKDETSSSSDSNSVYSLNFDLEAMSVLINNSQQKKLPPPSSPPPKPSTTLSHESKGKEKKEQKYNNKLNIIGNNNPGKPLPLPKQNNTLINNRNENQKLISKTKSPPFNTPNKNNNDTKETRIYGESKEMIKVSSNKKNFTNSNNKDNVNSMKDKTKYQNRYSEKMNQPIRPHKNFIVLKDDRDSDYESDSESDNEWEMINKERHNSPRNFIVLKEQNETENTNKNKNPIKIVPKKIQTEQLENDNGKINPQKRSPSIVKSKSMEYMKLTEKEKDKDKDKDKETDYTKENNDNKDTNNKDLKKRRTFNNFKSFNYYNTEEDNFFTSPKLKSNLPFDNDSKDNSSFSSSQPASPKAKIIPPKIKIIKKESTNFTKEPSPLSKVTTLNVSPTEPINESTKIKRSSVTSSSTSSRYSSGSSTYCSTCCNSNCSSCGGVDSTITTKVSTHSNSKSSSSSQSNTNSKTSQSTIPSEETYYYDIVTDHIELPPSSQITDTTLTNEEMLKAENELHTYSLPFLKLVENVKEKERERNHPIDNYLSYPTPGLLWEQIPVINNREKRQITIKTLSDYSDLDIPPSESGALSYYHSNASSYSVKENDGTNNSTYATNENDNTPPTPPSTPHSFTSFTDNLWQKIKHSKSTTMTPPTTTTSPTSSSPNHTLTSPTSSILKSPTSLKSLTTTFKNLTFPRSKKVNSKDEDNTKFSMTQQHREVTPINPIQYINSFKL
ncbi:hypothetical protein PIROE2DRAFT_60952 [Piromyces sp. E2]|nr:hypothetical protein PIROE2DRAFT_60952 [Piromyces sp. E2]|eukprot:OUM63985.1 hypothetical protein PIROE2DRAFT_60952 [Piromyces sp. E2]